MRTTLFALALSLAACKTTAPLVESAPPTVPQEDLAIVSQTLTEVGVKLTATVEAAQEPITVDSADYEFVVDGNVLRSGNQVLGIGIAPGVKSDVALEQSFTYVKDEADLKAMDTRGGSLLVSLRGTLKVTANTANGPKKLELPFARAKEVRTPRLPHVKLLDPEAGRFSDSEVQVLFRLGVVNPNPFILSLSSLGYEVELAGKQVTTGSQGQGDKVSPASTGVFDVPAMLSEQSHGKDAKKVVKGLVVPYLVKATLKTALYEEPLEAKGDIKLTPAK